MNDDPRTDPVGTVREHADGSRAVKVTETDGSALVWCSVSALLGVVWMTHEDLAEEWPVASPSSGQVRVFRYTKSNFKPVESLPVYRAYLDGRVTRQQHGDVERRAGHGALDFLTEQVRCGAMAESAELLAASGTEVRS